MSKPKLTKIQKYEAMRAAAARAMSFDGVEVKVTKIPEKIINENENENDKGPWKRVKWTVENALTTYSETQDVPANFTNEEIERSVMIEASQYMDDTDKCSWILVKD